MNMNCAMHLRYFVTGEGNNGNRVVVERDVFN